MSADDHNGADHQIAPPDEGTPLATIARGPDRQLRVRLKTFKNFPFIDLREWARRDANADWWPVKGKGVSVKLRELADVILALQKATQ